MGSTLANISANISKQTGQAKNSNTLAFCVDENYLPYALFVAEQFIHLHPDMPCDVCICLPDISMVPEKFINSKIRFIELSINGIESLPIGPLSLAAYHRLFLPKIFEDTYKYIIYLDADTYLNKPFFYDLLLHINNLSENFCVAAAADIIELKIRSVCDNNIKIKEDYINLYHRYNHIYRNSGMLVFNTKNYNDQNILNKVFTYAVHNIAHLQCHDQSALNGALLSDIALLPFDFNWQIHKLTYQITEAMDPYIIHFISNNKPWHTDNRYTKNYQKFYREFLSVNFPELTRDISTIYDQRRKSPKYNNPVKEFFSREWQNIKSNISNLKKTKNEYNIRSILTDTPFLVSSDKYTFKKNNDIN